MIEKATVIPEVTQYTENFSILVIVVNSLARERSTYSSSSLRFFS
jgi:hypothetical protein